MEPSNTKYIYRERSVISRRMERYSGINDNIHVWHVYIYIYIIYIIYYT